MSNLTHPNAWQILTRSWQLYYQRFRTQDFADGRRTEAVWEQQSGISQAEGRTWSASVSNSTWFTQNMCICFQFRPVLPEDHSEDWALKNISPFFQRYPILGVRIGPGGVRLVYHANRPKDLVSNQLTDNRLDDADRTLVDATPDAMSPDSK